MMFTETRVAVYDNDTEKLKAYPLDEAITLVIGENEAFTISRFAIFAWRTRFHSIADVFDVQNAIAMARLNGSKGTDLDEIERYI